MYKNQIEKIKELIESKANFDNATISFNFKKGFFYIANFIHFIDNTPIIQEIIQEEQEKFYKGGLEKENLYKNYLDICDSLRKADYTYYPDDYYSLLDLKNKLIDILDTKQFNLNQSINPTYDSKTRLLCLNNEEPINISKQATPNNQSVLLNYIFSQDLGVEISYSEILDQEFENKDIKCDITCRDINEKIQKETNYRIDNFLIYKKTKNGHVKLNPKYLSPN